MGKVKIINTQTGEIETLEWNNWAEFANTWDELSQWEAAIKKAKDQMKAEVSEAMGDQKEFTTGHVSGWYFQNVIRESKSYDPTVVRDVFEDDADRFMKVDKKALDAELAEHAEDEGSWPVFAKRLRESMITDSVSQFPKLVKPKK